MLLRFWFKLKSVQNWNGEVPEKVSQRIYIYNYEKRGQNNNNNKTGRSLLKMWKKKFAAVYLNLSKSSRSRLKS